MSTESDRIVNAINKGELPEVDVTNTDKKGLQSHTTSSQPYGLSLNAREVKYLKSVLCERMQFEVQRTIDNTNYTVSDELRLCIEILDKIDAVYHHYASDYLRSLMSDSSGYCEKRPGQK